MRIDRKINEREGFTLIELLIVIAIIAILASIAIPRFTTYRERSVRVSMIVDSRNAALALEAYFTDWERYPVGDADDVVGPGPAEGTWGGNPVRVSKGNTMSAPILSASSYRIRVENDKAGKNSAGINKSPLSLNSTWVCSFADGSAC